MPAKRKSVSLRKEHKSKKGGLTAKGRAYYNKKTGSNLKRHSPEVVRERGLSVRV